MPNNPEDRTRPTPTPRRRRAAPAPRGIFEPLERRQLLAALPFHLDFDADAGGILDKDGQGTGFVSIQPNKNGNQYQPSLIDLQTAGGLLWMTTNGTSTSGGNARLDNTLVNALQVDFDGTGQVFEIRTRISQGLSDISTGYEQAGIFFGPDQDNYLKLVALWHTDDGGSRLEFTDEYSDGVGGTYSTVSNGRVFVGSWSEVDTLDLRLVANPTTGVVTAWYKLDGAADWSQVPHSITVPTDKRSAFFTNLAKAGLIQFDKSDAQNLTVAYDWFTVERQAPATGPSVRSMRPAPGSTNVLRDAFVAVDLNLPNGALDPSTVNGASVHLINNANGQLVAATVNTTGGGDAITLTPSGILVANTSYTFHITSNVKDVSGASFQHFSGSFTTGTSVAESDPRIAFDRTIQAATVGIGWTGATVGPDGKLYGVTDGGEIHRFDIAADGSLTNRTLLFSYEAATGQKRLITGLAFDVDEGSGAGMTAYVSHGQWIDPGDDSDRSAADWTGVITRFTGAVLGSRQDVIVNLPRSVYDHLNNQPVFGPDGRLYFVMASNSAMGAPDSTWGNRSERLLSGAVLAADVRGIGGTPVDVKTEDGGSYDPYAPNAPVQIYATGIRNGWDLVWTSDGHLFVPANGSAAGGNTPAGPGNNPPAINGVTQTQNDFLFRVVEGGYYGHPNPLRGEYILNGGNPTSGPDPAEVSQYPVGTTPPPNYGGFAYDFGRNVSPNGVIEYDSAGAHFGGALDGKLLVVRYSGGDDILILDVAPDGSVSKAYGGSFGMTGMTDPLDIVQDPATGNIYVVEAGFRSDGGNPAGLRISLLKPIAAATATVASPRMLDFGAGTALHFSDIFGDATPGIAHRITITNTGAGPLALPADAFAITGDDAARFSLSGVPALPSTLAAGASLDIDVNFTAAAKGVVSAQLVIKTNDFSQPTRTIALRGLGTVGEGGSNEPSLQRILDLYGLPVVVGDPDPETTDYPAQTNVSGSDEVILQTLRKAGSGPVTIQLLASMGTANVNGFTDTSALSYYNPTTAAKVELARIAKTYAQTVNVTHSGTLSFSPGGDFGLVGTFFDFGPRDVWSQDARNTWESTADERRKVRFFPLKDADGQVVPNAYVFAFEEYHLATDQNDIVGVIYNVQAAGSPANAAITNKDGVPFHDRLIFSRIRDLDAGLPNKVHDTATFTITNSGGQTLTITSIGVSNGDFQVISGGTGGGAVQVAPGASHDVTVKFVYNHPSDRGSKVRSATLTIQSNDADSPNQSVELRGLWQSDSETGDNATSQEPNLYELVQVLGYAIDVGPNLGRDHDTGTNTGGSVERIGTETLSAYWRKADSGRPVEILQLAAWHRQTTTTNTRTRWYLQSNPNSPTFLFQHDAEYSQSFLPPLVGSSAQSRATFDPGSNAFGLKFDAHFSDPALNANQNDDGHAMRWWALHDREGNRIEDAWLVGHDYTGTTFANYDYQDNLYIVYNARPVSGPTAPQGLDATGDSSGNILEWSKNTEGNLAGYNVYRSDSPTGTFTKLNASLITAAGSDVSYTDTTAPVGEVSYYRVVPVDEHGTEGAAATADALRPSGPSVPAAPGGLHATTVEYNRVVLAWTDNSDNETGFRIERAIGAGAFTLVGTVGPNVAGFTDNTVDPLTGYRYRVLAYNAAGNSNPSNVVSVDTPADPTQIAAPDDLRLAEEAGPYRVALAWDDNSGNETGFRIERATGAGVFSVLATIQAADVTSFADETVQPRTDYRYRVIAFNTVASSAASNVLEVSTPGDPTQIAAPTGLSAVAAGPGQVNLSWTDNADNESSFVVERRTSGGAWEQIAIVGQDAQAYVDVAVGPETDYVYRVHARNALARSADSNEAAVTTPASDGYINDNIGDATGTTTIVTPGIDHDITATGSGMGGSADNLRFMHRLVIGDFDFVVRVSDLDPADPSSAAGLMVRLSTDPGAPALFLNTTSSGVTLTHRATAGAAAGSTGSASPGVPVSLRLVRSGDTFTAFHSADGTTWTQLAQVDIALPPAVRLGIAVASGSNDPTAAEFRGLGIAQEESPAAPTGLAAQVQGSHSVQLTWNDAAFNETAYRVERRNAGGTTWQVLTALADGTTIFTDSSVLPGSGYEYRVLAVNDVGEAASDVVSADVPNADPNPPTNLNGSAGSDTRRGVVLRWGGENVHSYRIERRINAGGEWGAWEEVTTVSGVARSLRDASARPGQTYQYRVIALGAGGEESGPSGVVTVATAQSPALPSPDLTANALSDRTIRLAWDDTSEGETGYRVQRRSPGGTWYDLGIAPAGSTMYLDQGLSGGNLYAYRVRAEGNGSVGPWSGVVIAETPAPAQWQHVAVGGVTSGSTDIRPGAHYDLVAGGSDVGGAADAFGYVYRHVSGDFDYAVRLISLDGADPERMAGLMARTSLDAGSRNVFMKLRESDAALSTRATDGGETTSAGDTATTPGQNWVRLQRTGNELVGYVGAGDGMWAEVARVTLDLGANILLGLATSAHSDDGAATARFRDLTDLRATGKLPAPPTGLAGSTEDGAIQLTWNDSSGGRSGFRLQRREVGGLWEDLGFVSAGVTNYADDDVTTGRFYEYRLAGESPAGVGRFGSAIMVEA